MAIHKVELPLRLSVALNSTVRILGGHWDTSAPQILWITVTADGAAPITKPQYSQIRCRVPDELQKV